MPVIVIGADTPLGESIIDELVNPPREVRAFVSDPDTAQRLKDRGVKVALGDVSDDSHIEGAATRCFCAVLVTEAAQDDRERSFATSPEAVKQGWARAVATAGVTRVIWVTGQQPPATETAEVVAVDPKEPDTARRVAELDEVRTLDDV